MDNIIDEIKEKVRIEDLVEESGIPLERRHGRYLRTTAPRGQGLHGLVIDTANNAYHFNGQDDSGDVFNWVMRHMHPGWDFRAALELLAKRAGLTVPTYGEKDMKARLAARANEDALNVAAKIFHRWLTKAPAALEYVHKRGWTDETLERALMGFSGSATAAELSEMRSELVANGVEPLSPAAVAIMGLHPKEGVEGVTAWCKEHGIEPDGKWLDYGSIAGMMSPKTPRLVYASQYMGRVIYLLGRNLAFSDDKKSLAGSDDPKSYNLNGLLVGGRKLYFNSLYGRKVDRVVLVEGPGDAETWAQWGVAAIAAAGTAWQDHEALLRDLGKDHESVYISPDADKEGWKVVRGKAGNYPLADVLGPLLRVVRLPAKDANDLLQRMTSHKLDAETQGIITEHRLGKAETIAEVAARDAAALKGNNERLKAMERAFEIMAKIERRTFGLMTSAFVRATGMGVVEINRAMKAARGEAEKAGEDGNHFERVPTMGGWFPENPEGTEGYLLEPVYDMKSEKAQLAFAHIDMKQPERREIGLAPYVDIKGMRYEPLQDDIIKFGTVMLPSDLGPEKQTSELLTSMELFIRRYFLLDNSLQYKTASQYALFTWLNDCFDALPYLRARGGPGSGKSELMLLVGRVCYRMMITSSLTSLAGFKGMAHLYKGTLMIDEADSVPKEHQDELRALLNGRAMKEQARIITMMESIKADGSHTYVPSATYVYGPTLLTMYGAFKDPATETRCITFDLFQKDVIELEEAGIEPGVVQQSMKDQALIMRNMLLRWRLKTWLPKLEVPEGVKISNKNVSPRMNQIMRPLKILAYLLKDKKMQEDLDMIAEANYEDEMNRRAGSFEALLLRVVVAIDEDQQYAKYIKTGKLRMHGVVRYVLYKDLAYVANAIIDAENMNEKAPEKKKDDSVKANTIGTVCRDAFRLPVERTKEGWAVVLEKRRIEIGKLRYGLHDADLLTEKEAPQQLAMMDEPAGGEPDEEK